MKRIPLSWKRQGQCIVVTGRKLNKAGYVVVQHKGKQTYLHRSVCERRHGSLESVTVRHSCDNPACINPDHLLPGTKADNSADMAARNRSTHGTKNRHAKLTEAQVRKIRMRVDSHRSIAKDFGVCHQTVGRIIARKTWTRI